MPRATTTATAVPAPSAATADGAAPSDAPVEKKKRASRYRGWVVTWNNYEEPDDITYVQSLIQEYCSYGVYGKEVAPTTGTRHLQMYVEFTNPHSFNGVVTLFRHHHVERREGTPAQARDYCLKDCIPADSWEYGTLPRGAGARTDLEHVRHCVRNDKPIREYAMDIGPQALRYAENLSKYAAKKRTWEPTVVWLYGPTGSGKTQSAHRMCAVGGCDDPFVINDQLKWWDGYDGHSHVIIDDFRSCHVTLSRLLVLLDRYACTLEVKGGTRQLVATHMYITSPFPPHLAYKLTDSIDGRMDSIHQLLRRIHYVLRIDHSGDVYCEKEGAWGAYTPADGYDLFNRFLAESNRLSDPSPSLSPDSTNLP